MAVTNAGDVEIPNACADQGMSFYKGPCFFPILPAHVDRVAKIKNNRMRLCPPEDESCAREDNYGKDPEYGWIVKAALVSVEREHEEQGHESADRLG